MQKAETMAAALAKQQTTWEEVFNKLKGALLPIINKGQSLKIFDIVKSVRIGWVIASDANSNFNTIKNTLGTMWTVVKGIGSA